MREKQNPKIPKEPESLCHSCKWYQEVKGKNNEIFRQCGIGLFNKFENEIPFAVKKCSDHAPKSSQTLIEMERIALYIEVNKKSAGFAFVKKHEFETKPWEG